MGAAIVLVSVTGSLLASQFYPGAVSPSLVGLAINYTLLVPIYLNWVVKFLADVEMYMGSVERVQQYADMPAEDYNAQGKDWLFHKQNREARKIQRSFLG